MPSRSYRDVDLQPVLHPRQEVVAAVPRSGVDGARALLERDVISEHAKRIAIEKRMAEADAIELLSLHPRDGLTECASCNGGNLRRKGLGDDHGPPIHVIRRVVEIRVECDREIRRNGPWSRRPDEHGNVAPFEL